MNTLHPDQVVQMMSEGTVIITPNNRLSDTLLAHYLTLSGKTVCPKPACFAYPTFLKHAFKKLVHHTPHMKHPRLLAESQSRRLWRFVLTNSAYEEASPELIDALQQTFTICENWLISLPHPYFQINTQTQQYEHFHLAFQAALDKHQAITEAQLARYFLKQSTFQTIHSMAWICFDDYTPSQKALQNHCMHLGIQQQHIELKTVSRPTSFQYPAEDEYTEFSHASLFVQKQLDLGATRVAIIVPDLAQQAPKIKRHLKRYFRNDLFNFSLGKPLTDYPLVAHALQWLQIEPLTITHHQVKLLLTSPYLVAGESEIHTRSQLLKQSPQLSERIISFEQFKLAIHKRSPQLFKALNDLMTYPKTASPHDWTTLFLTRLKQLGFPGQRGLNSTQYQCLERFRLLFDEFVGLSWIDSQMDQQTALATFHDLASHCIFQPEKSASPIQVLGLLEAAGCTFDAIWFCHATQQTLPHKTHYNPFIPIALQRETKMPYSDAKQELNLAEKRLNRFACVSDCVVYSYPMRAQDLPMLPSTFITHLPLLPKRHHEQATTVLLQEAAESYHYPLAPFETNRGGSSRLSHQALCPFRAFAHHRLHATDYPKLTDGLDASTRGQIIHSALEAFWQAVGSHQALLSYNEKAIQNILTQAIENALKPLIQRQTYSFPEPVAAIERDRLKQLINQLIHWEKSREAFQIDALEKNFTLQLNALEFRIRLDRVDILPSGEKWIIDYKSRLPSPLPFDEERPEHPQLLLYALLDHTIKGLIYIELKQNQINCKGFLEEKNHSTAIRTIKSETSWETYQTLWRERLTKLADEFTEGHCPPAPIKKSTCQDCPYHALCRIQA